MTDSQFQRLNRPNFELSIDVPASIRVDPETAFAEWLKRQAPDAPAPLFSTKALVHGRNAVGARRLREGFSFSEQMDLLWALGFPQVAFIMDGFPVADSMDALLDFYGARDKRWWLYAQLKTGRIYTGRGAFARLYECLPPSDDPDDDTADSVLEFTDEELFLEFSEPRELDEDDVKTMLVGSHRFGDELESDSLLLEALVGPDLVVKVLLDLLEEGSPHSAFNIVHALLPLGLRLDAAGSRQARERLRSWVNGPGTGEETPAAWFLDPEQASGESVASKGTLGISFRPYLVSDWRSRVASEYAEELRMIPRPHDAFVGPTEEILEIDRKRYDDYEIGDAANVVVHELSACRSAGVLPLLLRAGTRSNCRDAVSAWFHAHIEEVKTELENLARGDDALEAELARGTLSAFS